MKIKDLSKKKLEKYLEKNGISEKGNKKELVERILTSFEQKAINEIEACWEDGNLLNKDDKIDLDDELGKEITHFIEVHENEKIKILKSYDDLQNKKTELKKRSNQQQETISNLPNILRFTVGQEVSFSKSNVEEHPNSIIYTLICSNQYQQDQKNYLNFVEEDMLAILKFLRHKTITNPSFLEQYGFLSTEFSNEICLKSDDISTNFDDNIRNNYQKLKKKIEEELEKKSKLLKLNFENYEKQINGLQELVYNDAINLNVSGKVFSISKTKLEKHKDTYFAPLSSGKWELENNTIFIDRDYEHFHMIHYFLVYDTVHPNFDQYYDSLNKEEQDILHKELDYYQLDTILNYLRFAFRNSKVLTEEEAEYVETLYPGKWRLIPKEKITDTIQKTTVLILTVDNLKYSKLTEYIIDLRSKKTLAFDRLHPNRRGTTMDWRHDTAIKQYLLDDIYEIYEKI